MITERQVLGGEGHSVQTEDSHLSGTTKPQFPVFLSESLDPTVASVSSSAWWLLSPTGPAWLAKVTRYQVLEHIAEKEGDGHTCERRLPNVYFVSPSTDTSH